MIAQILKILLLKIQIKKLSGLAILRKTLNFISKSKTAKKRLKSSYIRKKILLIRLSFKKLVTIIVIMLLDLLLQQLKWGSPVKK